MLSCLSLLLAVTTTIQATPAPTSAPTARLHRRVHISAVAPLAAASADFQAAAMAVEMAQPDFAVMSAQAPDLAMSAQALQTPVYALTGLADLSGLSGLAGLATLADIGGLDDDKLEPSWPQDAAQQQPDPADSVYRVARQALNGQQYNRAARLFGARARSMRCSMYEDTSGITTTGPRSAIPAGLMTTCCRCSSALKTTNSSRMVSTGRAAH